MRVEGLQIKLLAPELIATASEILTTTLIMEILLVKGPKLVGEIANIPLSAVFLLMFPRQKN
jgi:hypothetical protein